MVYDYTSTLGDGTFKPRPKGSYLKLYEKILLPIAVPLIGVNIWLLMQAEHLGFF